MAGGTFSAYNKVRPGAYINTISEQPTTVDDDRGTVLLINGINYGWGASGVVDIDQGASLKSILGVNLTDDKAKTIRQAFVGGASVVKLINFNDGSKATVSDNSLPYKITAKYNGDRGNDITLDFIQNIVDSSKVTVKTIFGTEVVDVQTIAISEPEKLQGNDYVDVQFTSGKLDLQGEKAVKLTGGSYVDVTNNIDAMSSALSNAIQSEEYNVVTAAGIDANSKLHQLLAEMVSDLRKNQGLKVTAVVPYAGFDYDDEAVSVVGNGVMLEDGTILENSTICAWFAGKSASVALNKSLTYVPYEGAMTAYPSLSQENIIKALQAGRIIFTNRRNGNTVIEQDINSLKTFTAEKSPQFRKNRELRALDTISNHVEDLFEDNFIGSVTNNADGRTLLKSSVTAYFKQLVTDGIIGDFDQADLSVVKGNADDTVVMTYSITPVDSMEKLYNTITVTR